MGIMKVLALLVYICLLPVYLICWPVIYVLKAASKPKRRKTVIRNRRT